MIEWQCLVDLCNIEISANARWSAPLVVLSLFVMLILGQSLINIQRMPLQLFSSFNETPILILTYWWLTAWLSSISRSLLVQHHSFYFHFSSMDLILKLNYCSMDACMVCVRWEQHCRSKLLSFSDMDRFLILKYWWLLLVFYLLELVSAVTTSSLFGVFMFMDIVLYCSTCIDEWTLLNISIQLVCPKSFWSQCLPLLVKPYYFQNFVFWTPF